MTVDDLSAPLGSDRNAVLPRSKVFVFLALAGLLGVGLAAFVVWRAASHHWPSQGLSVIGSPKQDGATRSLPALRFQGVDLAPAANGNAASPPDVIAVTKAQEFALAAPDETEPRPGEQVITIIDGRSGARQRIKVPAAIPSGRSSPANAR